MWHDKLTTQETSSLRLENASIKKTAICFFIEERNMQRRHFKEKDSAKEEK